MNLLVLKPDHLGDLVLALPALWEAREFLRKEDAGTRIDLICSSANKIWTEILPWLGHAFAISHPRYQRPPSPYPRKLALQAIKAGWGLRKNRYDVAIELTSTPNDLLGKFILIASRARKRYSGKGAYSFLLHRAFNLPKENGKLHQTEILASRFPPEWGVTGKTSPKLWMPQNLRYQATAVKPRILISPWAGTSAKQWPVSHWRAFLKEPLPLEKVIVAPPDKIKEAHSLAEGTGTSVLEVRSIRDTLELLASSRLVIAMDSAVAHFAWLTGTPLIQLFAGTTELERWRSLAPNAAYLHAFPACAPCHLEACNQLRHFCMEDILPRHLSETVQAQLRDQF